MEGAPRMNFDSLEYFAVLARERSFTRAAEALHITQQSLSSHIAGLERELDCQLVVRRSPLELTFAGQTFLRYAEELRRTQQTMQREFCDISQNQKGELRVGIAFTRGRVIMPRLISTFQREYPNVQVTLIEDSNDALQKLLLDGDIDLAVAEFSKAPPEIELRDFYEESIVLCLSDALLARCALDPDALADALRGGDLRALRDVPFVLGPAEDIAGRIGRELLRRSGVKPSVRAVSANIETLLALCVQGVGACFSPENLVYAALSPDQLAQLRIYPLAASYPIRIGFLKRAYQWRMISRFLSAATASPAQNGCIPEGSALSI